MNDYYDTLAAQVDEGFFVDDVLGTTIETEADWDAWDELVGEIDSSYRGRFAEKPNLFWLNLLTGQKIEIPTASGALSWEMLMAALSEYAASFSR